MLPTEVRSRTLWRSILYVLLIICPLLLLYRGSDEENEKLMEAVNRSGKMFLIHTKLEGKIVLRFAVGSPQTRVQHIDDAWDLIRSESNKIV